MNSTVKPEVGADILIAEDSATQALQLQHILERNGYRVTAAGNGRLALEAAQRRKPALIISDVVMPEMNGYELCGHIKADARLSDVPIILVTSLSDPQEVIRALECGADNFVVKPYEAELLLRRMEFVLINSRIHQTRQPGSGLVIAFGGQNRIITAGRLQILNLLLSTYEAAIQRNKELILKTAELEAANRSLGAANRELETFTSYASHDLRQPLNGMIGFAELLISEQPGALNAKQMEYLQDIQAGGWQLLRLTEDLLNFARLGQQPLAKTSLNVGSLISEILQVMRDAEPNRNVELRVGPLPDVQADAPLLRHVFVNLLSNAFKFTRNVPSPVIEVSGRRKEHECTYCIRDNGVGFDMKNVRDVFAIFKRLHSDRDFEGTGVGLSIVQRIIERHGGSISATAVVGQGAEFMFTLPIQPTIPAPS
jgi:two-component system sensor histidine kinase/response regulator